MMQYKKKLLSLAALLTICSIYAPVSLGDNNPDRKFDSLNSQKNKINETVDCSCSQPRPTTTPRPPRKEEATVDCSCSQPKPPRPVVREEATVDCSCSQPKPPRPTKTEAIIDCSCSQPKPPRPVIREEATLDCGCSQPKPPRPVVREEATVDCSCTTKPPRPTKTEAIVDCACSQPRPTTQRPPRPKVEESPCPFAKIEKMINRLAEKVALLKSKLVEIQDKEKAEIVSKFLDTIADGLEDISNSQLTPEEAKEKLLVIKRLIARIEDYISEL